MGGVVVKTIRPEGELASIDIDGVVPLLIATTVILTVVKRWLHQNRLRDDELHSREQAVASRELIAAQNEGIQTIRIHGLAQKLHDANRQLLTQGEELAELRINHEEVMANYNLLIEQVLRDGHERFTAGPKGAQRPVQGGAPRRRDEHQRGPSPVTALQPREHQESV